jgi:hypothetical protein
VRTSYQQSGDKLAPQQALSNPTYGFVIWHSVSFPAVNQPGLALRVKNIQQRMCQRGEAFSKAVFTQVI